jgi:hypothetical protein
MHYAMCRPGFGPGQAGPELRASKFMGLKIFFQDHHINCRSSIYVATKTFQKITIGPVGVPLSLFNGTAWVWVLFPAGAIFFISF